MATTFGKRAAPAYAAPVSRAAAAPSPAYAAPRAAAPSMDLPTIRFPLVTICLSVLLTVIFMLELQHAPVPGLLSARALAADGAIEGDLIFGHGEWWRLFTAPMLHASWGHLIGNVVVFAIVGFMLEPLIGPRWFAGLYVIGGLGGTLVSILLNPGDIPAVGASGAIMGVLGGAFICGSSARSGPKGRKMQTWALRLILPALIPMAADSHTDFAGHLGGVLAGIAVGIFMLAAWTRGEDRPAFAGGAAVIGALGIVAGLASFALFAQGTNAAVAANAHSPLMPDELMPGDIDIGSDRARDLLARYPHDPRAHVLRGFAFMTHDHDLADAEEQLREALATKDLLAAKLTDDFPKEVTILLSLTVAYERRPDQAKALGGPLCDYAEENHSDLHDMMVDKEICP